MSAAARTRRQHSARPSRCGAPSRRRRARGARGRRPDSRAPPKRRRTELAQHGAVGDGLVEAEAQRWQRRTRRVVLTRLQLAELHRRDLDGHVLRRHLRFARLLRGRFASAATCGAERVEHLGLGSSDRDPTTAERTSERELVVRRTVDARRASCSTRSTPRRKPARGGSGGHEPPTMAQGPARRRPRTSAAPHRSSPSARAAHRREALGRSAHRPRGAR